MDCWEKLLNPPVLRQNLISASVFISAYEICKDSIIDKPKSFFTDSWSTEKIECSEKYKSEVLSLAKSPLKSSFLWFKELGAVDDKDIDNFSKARELRNKIAHNLPNFISDPEYEIDQKVFEGLLDVTHKIGVWWVINCELPTNPDYNGEEIDVSEIQIGTIMMVRMMMDIAYGNEPEEGYYYKNIKHGLAKKTPNK